MIPRSGKPYIWVTWITGLLAGSDKCEWRVWVKARHSQYEKKPQHPDSSRQLALWIEDHDRMTVDRHERLKSEGYEVLVEDANSFKLTGSKAVLGGKPDLVALKQSEKFVLVIDEKSGKEKSQYLWQVLLYMFALGLTKYRPQDGWTIRGEIEYKTSVVPVPSLTAANIERIGKVIALVSGKDEPERVPSKWECQYCDILGCPDRFQEPATTEGDASHVF